MISGVTMKINVDDYIINTLKEDITSEDVSTNAVMPENKNGKADLICKSNGIICGLDVFERTFKILDEKFPITMPYMPSDRPFMVYCSEALTDPKNGDFDTVAIWYVKKPNGDREEINRFFKEGEEDWVEIDEAEYQKRKEMEMTANATD